MFCILVVHANDADQILDKFRLALPNALFWNVEDTKAKYSYDADSFEYHVDACIILASNVFIEFLTKTESHKSLSALSELSRVAPAYQINLRPLTRDATRLFASLFNTEKFVAGNLLELPPHALEVELEKLSDFLRRTSVEWLQHCQPSPQDRLADHSPDHGGGRDHQIISDPRMVEMLFATNRVPSGRLDTIDFTGERNSELTFGAARVRIPEDHKLGRLELPMKASWIRLRFSSEATDERRHFILRDIGFLDINQFIGIVRDDPAHSAIVFTHGFNTSFKEAVFRFAQIIWDMQFRATPVLFSWPSRGAVLSYAYDLNSALGARDAFAQIIQVLHNEAHVQTIHIIAHSMGNFVALDALNTLAQTPSMPTLSEIVMAAPDVDADVFPRLLKNIQPFVRGMTLYASSADKALVASRAVAQKPRAGDVPAAGPLIVDGLESIDVTALGDEMFGLNHNMFASSRSLIDDIGRLLQGARPPHQRSPQIRCVPEGTSFPLYWRYAR